MSGQEIMPLSIRNSYRVVNIGNLEVRDDELVQIRGRVVNVRDDEFLLHLFFRIYRSRSIAPDCPEIWREAVIIWS